jgi:hypothetical protein
VILGLASQALCGRELKITARGVVQENICDCVGDGKAGRAFEPEEFAAGIELEKVKAREASDSIKPSMKPGRVKS